MSGLFIHASDDEDAGSGQEGYEAADEGNDERRKVESGGRVDVCNQAEDGAGYEAGDEDELLGEIFAFIRRTSKVGRPLP